MNLFYIIATFLLALAANTSASPIIHKFFPVKPDHDPFYDPARGYENRPLGAILKIREPPNPLGVLFFRENIYKVYQIQYRSSNSSGGALAAIATVIIPHNANLQKLLSIQILQDSAYINCAPSYAVQALSSPTAIVGNVENLIISTMLNLGYAVVAPDYNGPQSAFAAGVNSAHTTLDAIRMVLASEKIMGVKENASVGLYGCSGGSIPTGWATELQPDYYSELKIAGAAMSGVVPNITAAALYVNKTPFAGFIPAGFLGLANEYPEVESLIASQLKKNGKRKLFYRVKSQCILEDLAQFAGHDIFDYFNNGREMIYHSSLQSVLNENTMGKHTPKAPILINHAIPDEISPLSEVEKLYNHYCNDGVDIEFRKDFVGEHISEILVGLPYASAWLKDRMDGKAVKKGCRSISETTSLLRSEPLQIFPPAAVNLAMSLYKSFTGPSEILAKLG